MVRLKRFLKGTMMSRHSLLPVEADRPRSAQCDPDRRLAPDLSCNNNALESQRVDA